MTDLLHILQQYWGYSTFRLLQAEAMRAAIANRDSLVVLPTEGGKSLCFQAPGSRADLVSSGTILPTGGSGF